MRTSVALVVLLLPLVLCAQSKMKLSNGWDYAVVAAGSGTKTTRQNAIEAHFTIRDVDGRILGSTLPLGAPSYQILPEKSDKFQAACEATAEGGRYIFYIPAEDFKKVMGGALPPGMQLTGDHVEWEMEVIRVLPAKPSIATMVLSTLKNQGADAAFQQFQQLSNERNPDVYFGEVAVNSLGYAFLAAGKMDHAVNVFEYNVKMNPNSANAYDSLAEGLMKAGQKQAAIEHYRKSLEINPSNDNARKMIGELEKQ
ncbi:MAG: tetratricopeptide repeat protein [Saprospiraceae bacterium]